MSVYSVSTSTTSQILQNTVQRLQNQLNTATSESSTGLLANIGLTLGATSAQDINMHQQMADLAAITASNAVVTAQLSTASDALTSLQSTTSSMLSANRRSRDPVRPARLARPRLQQTAAGALATFSTTMNASVGGVYVFGGVNSGVGADLDLCTKPASAAQTAVRHRLPEHFRLLRHVFGTRQHDHRRADDELPERPLRGPLQRLELDVELVFRQRYGGQQPHRRQPDHGHLDQRQSSAFQGTAQALTMLSEFGGLGLSSDAYSALMTAAQSTMNTANNGLIEANAAVGTMQNQVTDANSAISLQTNVLSTQINSVEVRQRL